MEGDRHVVGAFNLFVYGSPAEAHLPPAWLGASSGIVFALTGAIAFLFFSSVLTTLFPLAFRSFRAVGST